MAVNAKYIWQKGAKDMEKRDLLNNCKVEYIDNLPVDALYAIDDNILYIKTKQVSCLEKIKDACSNTK